MIQRVARKLGFLTQDLLLLMVIVFSFCKLLSQILQCGLVRRNLSP